MSDPTEVRINLNARVTVRLTPKGREMVAAYYRDLLPDLPHLWPEVPAAGEPYSDQLWSIANILGPGMRPGAHPMIEGMTFTAPVGKCVEVVRGEPAPDAPGLDLAPILARADAATEGPWRLQTAACDHPDADNHSAIKGGGALVVACAEDADATFIAAARTDIPALVSEVTRLRAALAHAITTGCAAVADALREGEEARAEATRLRAALSAARAKFGRIMAETDDPESYLDGLMKAFEAAADGVQIVDAAMDKEPK